MNSHTIPLVLKARVRFLALFLAGGLAAGAGIGLLRGQVHHASTDVMASTATPQAADPGSANSQIAPMLAADYLSTQVEIIRSDRVAERAAQLLRLDADPVALAAYRASGSGQPPLAWFAKAIQSHLKVIPSIGSRVISIEYAAGTPEQAADGANALARAYQDVSLDMAVAPSRQSDDWYARNLADLRDRLNAAQAKLLSRQRELGVVAPLSTSNPGGVEAEEARLTALSQNLAMAQAARTSAQSRTGGGALPDAMLNPVVQQLDADIKRLEGQRAEMATRLGPNAQQMREIAGQIAGLERERAKQAAMVSQGAATSAGQASANVQQLEGELNFEKARVIQSRAGRAELGLLQQDVDGLRRAYDELVARQSNARIAGTSEMTNVVVLSPARPDPGAGYLLVALFAVLGSVVGLFVGATIVALRELTDRRIRTPEDAVDCLGIPNLGGIHIPLTFTRALPPPKPRLLTHKAKTDDEPIHA